MDIKLTPGINFNDAYDVKVKNNEDGTFSLSFKTKFFNSSKEKFMVGTIRMPKLKYNKDGTYSLVTDEKELYIITFQEEEEDAD